MVSPFNPAKHLDDAGRTLVREAVAQAEQHTSGEIVPVLAERSDAYRDVALAWAAIAAFGAMTVVALFPDTMFGLIDRITGGWNRKWSAADGIAMATALGMVKFLCVWALQFWRPVQLLLLPGTIAAARVRERALVAFRIGAEQRTHGRTGVVIYLSLVEHRAEIVADEAIASKVPVSAWSVAMEALLEQVRHGHVAEGMAAAIGKVGTVLALHFPKDSNDKNQLPDRLIEL